MNLRITLTDTGEDVLIKMAGGVPGALKVLMDMLKDGKQIDPDGFMGGLGAIMLLDTWQIYEERIWMLYKDVCKESLTDMLGILRAVQLGFLAKAFLDHAIDGCGCDLDVEALVSQVRDRLPRFKKAEMERMR